MNGAELKTLREALVLPIAWCSGFFKVAERSWRFWESGNGNIPEEIIQTLNGLAVKMESTAIKAADMIISTSVKEFTLYRYKTDNDLWEAMPDMRKYKLPASYHAKTLFLTKRKLEENNVKCDIVYSAD